MILSNTGRIDRGDASGASGEGEVEVGREGEGGVVQAEGGRGGGQPAVMQDAREVEGGMAACIFRLDKGSQLCRKFSTNSHFESQIYGVGGWIHKFGTLSQIIMLFFFLGFPNSQKRENIFQLISHDNPGAKSGSWRSCQAS